jgi:hypothetical protein
VPLNGNDDKATSLSATITIVPPVHLLSPPHQRQCGSTAMTTDDVPPPPPSPFDDDDDIDSTFLLAIVAIVSPSPLSPSHRGQRGPMTTTTASDVFSPPLDNDDATPAIVVVVPPPPPCPLPRGSVTVEMTTAPHLPPSGADSTIIADPTQTKRGRVVGGGDR